MQIKLFKEAKNVSKITITKYWIKDNFPKRAPKVTKAEAELYSMHDNIVKPSSTSAQTPSSSPTQTPTQTSSDDNFFTKAWKWIWTKLSDAWSWIWKQWNNIRDKNKWKDEAWKNVLRTVWFAATWVWAVSLAYKWIKKLFWWWKNEEEEDDEEETKPKKKKKKKPFWDRRYWKALKYSIIWTPIYYVTHGLMTNKWNILDMFDRNKKKPDAISSAENQVEATEELKEKNPEKFEKYKKLWENVDSQYNQLMDKEIKDWWWGMSIADGYKKYCDNSKLSLEDFKATVPMCMDNQFWAVSNMLSEWGYYAYMREKDIKEFTEMFTKTVDDWTKKLSDDV